MPRAVLTEDEGGWGSVQAVQAEGWPDHRDMQWGFLRRGQSGSLRSLRDRKEVSYRGFAAGLGRLGFSALALRSGEATSGAALCLVVSDSGEPG